MNKKITKNLFIFILAFAALAAFSGCAKKNQPVAENNIPLSAQAGLSPSSNEGELKDTATSTEKNAGDTATSTDEIDTSDWKIYRNEEYGFKMKYPNGWVVEKYDTEILFGTPESVSGGYIWGISIYQLDELEKIIAQNGSQFYDRKESRSDIIVNKKLKGIIVTITTDTYKDWISKTIYFANNGQLFAIGNGSKEDKRFKYFYSSFEFIN